MASRFSRRSETLSAICATRRTLAVAGTHGKTTTSSMLALVLAEAGLDPSFIIGGEVTQLGTGAHWSAGDWFVVEADESDGTFLDLPRRGAIVTNVEPDHLEHYGGFEGLRDAFDRFVLQTPGPVVVCIDDPLAADLVARVAARASDRHLRHPSDADYRMIDVDRQDGYGVTWAVESPAFGRLRLDSAGAGPAQRPQRHGRRPRWRSRSARIAEPRSRGPGPLPRGGPAVRVPRRGRRA